MHGEGKILYTGDKTTEDDNPTVLVIGPSLLDLEKD